MGQEEEALQDVLYQWELSSVFTFKSVARLAFLCCRRCFQCVPFPMHDDDAREKEH